MPTPNPPRYRLHRNRPTSQDLANQWSNSVLFPQNDALMELDAAPTSPDAYGHILQTLDVVNAGAAAVDCFIGGLFPASKNRWYQKLLPHFVAYGRLFAPDRADVFERELRPWARFREATGQSTYVLNPVKAETYGAADLLHGGLAVPARQSMGVGRRPAELRQVFK